MHSVCVVEPHVNYTKILIVAQQYSYGKFMSLATIKSTLIFAVEFQIYLPDINLLKPTGYYTYHKVQQ